MLGFSTPARWTNPSLCFHRVDEVHTWRWDWEPSPRFAPSVDVPSVFSAHWKTVGFTAALTLDLPSLGF